MLFTRLFIKDLFWSLIFILSVYGITHNPITQPKPQPIPGNWSIQIMQHPLLFGITGHNYLALRNQDGDIVEELHGLATDGITGQWKYIGTKSTDVLKVWEFSGPRYYLAEKAYPGKILTEGTWQNMKTLWDMARGCKKPINDKNIPYPMLGVNLNGETENSNSVAYTLSLCMGFDAKHVGLVTPGEKKNLLQTN